MKLTNLEVVELYKSVQFLGGQNGIYWKTASKLRDIREALESDFNAVTEGMEKFEESDDTDEADEEWQNFLEEEREIDLEGLDPVTSSDLDKSDDIAFPLPMQDAFEAADLLGDDI